MSATKTQPRRAFDAEISGPEASAILGISPTAFKRGIDSGYIDIPYTVPFKQRRYKRADVERWKASRTHGSVILDEVEGDELR